MTKILNLEMQRKIRRYQAVLISLRKDPCPSAWDRGNHDTNVSFLVPDAVSAPSERAGGAGKFLIAGEGGRVPLCLIRGCSVVTFFLISLVLAVRRYQLLLAPTPALSQRKVPTCTWKYHTTES